MRANKITWPVLLLLTTLLEISNSLTETLQKAHFFHVQMDGSANIEDKLLLAIYFDPHSSDGSIHTRNRFLCVRQPESVDALGLYNCFNRAMTYLGLDSIPSKLVRFGCDGASVNMGPNALTCRQNSHG